MKVIEVLDLYKLHANPEELKGHDVAYEKVPELAFNKYAQKFITTKDPSVKEKAKRDLIKRKDIWATVPWMANWYAMYVIQGRFPEGEKAIASSPHIAFTYAINVVKGRFPQGEKAIASSSSELKKEYEDQFGWAIKTGQFNEVLDPKNLMDRPRDAVLKQSRPVKKPLFQKQTNRAKSFKHFIADKGIDL